ncbi:protein-arginine deiminase domain-containing protein [Candidatus Binatia bacterium]|nr:protein-arginine deiminase domain-containing protein [Candidatus Binatia bacterium]
MAVPPLPPPILVPPALVALGSALYNALCAPGVAGSLHADFDRSGSVDQTDPEYLERVKRPGAILLPNLDISDFGRLPVPRPADLRPHLDATDAAVNGAADQGQLTLAKVRKPNPCHLSGTTVTMKVHADDARRIRVFQVGAGAAPVLGVGKPMGAPEEFDLPGVAAIPWAFDFLVEAVTLAGDPVRGAPGGSSPNKPDPYAVNLPSGSSGTPIVSARAPGEIWVELIHGSVAATLAAPYDVALFTVAPFMLLSNLQPVRRVYTVYFRDDNHNFVFDFAAACRAALGATVSVPADSSTPFTPHTPAHTGPLYLVDGARFPDEWMQDELEIGYCWAPHAWMHVVLHCKRGRPLKDFVHGDMLDPGLGLFDGIDGAPLDGQDYGGNLEVSPPVVVPTPAIGRDAAGPSLPSHPRAPFGKIILGDCTPRPAHDDFRKFLLAQKVQPVLALDTSWLSVGHVDEFLSFVPASSGKPFRLLIASVWAMDELLEATKSVPVLRGRTNLQRGQWIDSRGTTPAAWAEYDEVSVEDLIAASRTFNQTLRTSKLVAIERRLKRGLNLDAADIVRVPTYFAEPAVMTAVFGLPGTTTVAKTVGMVNLQVVNTHLLVPKPFGPRVRPADATTVLRKVLDRLGLSGVAVRLTPGAGFFHWAYPGEDVGRFACYFAQPSTAAARQNIINHIKTGAVLTPANATLVAATRAAILADPRNAGAPAAGTFPTWRKMWIPEDTVDLLEAYMLSVLEPLGLTVHFVDDWYYHAGMGEVHCGSNARREPPELNGAARWWDSYDPDVNTNYDPAA